ncbi:hypothetical protein Tco_1186079 [Tanacetum coccineum]
MNDGTKETSLISIIGSLSSCIYRKQLASDRFVVCFHTERQMSNPGIQMAVIEGQLDEGHQIFIANAASQRNMTSYQMDVKTAFLNGRYQEKSLSVSLKGFDDK